MVTAAIRTPITQKRAAMWLRTSRIAASALAAEMLGVFLSVSLPFFRQVIQGKNGGNRAHGHAGAAINTFHRINEKLVYAFKLRRVLFGMDAVHRARIHAR